MALAAVNLAKQGLATGPVPVTRTGDYSDVVVLDADGNRIPWSDVSRIDDAQMRDLMRQIVNRRYNFHLKCDHRGVREDDDLPSHCAGKGCTCRTLAGFAIAQ